jgi:stage II sporulation protein R
MKEGYLMRLKKKQLRVLFLMLLSLFAYSTWVAYSTTDLLSNEDFIRFHVIANSDSSEDQALKLIVRDALLDTINEGLAAETMAMAKPNQEKVSLDIDKSKDYIQENLPEIERVAKAVVSSEGYDYPVKADLGITWIPEKTYGSTVFPAGNYEALNVTIGDGGGQNWWCVLFPPLCLIGVEAPGEEAGIQEIYKDVLLDQKYRVLWEQSEQPKPLQLKFKTLELFQK